MKKIFFILLSVILFTACNNGKEKDVKDRLNEQSGADDYRSKSKGDNNSKSTDYSNTNEDWSAADIKEFNKKCLTEVAQNNKEFADKFCPCFLGKMQSKFSSLSDMDNKSTEKEGADAAKDCIETLGLDKNQNNLNANKQNNWPEIERRSFITSCEKKAIAGGSSRLVAQGYCACMLDKMENLYPDINDIGRLTENELNKILNKYRDRCLEEN